MTTESTNDLAREWALEGAENGAVVVAEEQTVGRGRFGRTWVAPGGTGLLFSVIYRHALPRERVLRYTMVGAVSVRAAIATIPGINADDVTLKWANDVHLDGRKVCGILPEAIWEGNALQAVIIGIGINVRVNFAGTDLADKATSIEQHTTHNVDRAQLLANVLETLDVWAARANELSLFLTWRSALSTLGQRVTAVSVSSPGRITMGRAVDVDDDGALLIRDDKGRVHRVISGEVTLQTDSST